MTADQQAEAAIEGLRGAFASQFGQNLIWIDDGKTAAWWTRGHDLTWRRGARIWSHGAADEQEAVWTGQMLVPIPDWFVSND